METNGVTYGVPRDPAASYRCGSFAGLVWTFGRLERWQRRPIWLDTDWRSFAGLQVFGWHVGAVR